MSEINFHSAAKEAASILRDEANCLAILNEDEIGKQLPHRAKVAIRREVERFRRIADILEEGKTQE